MVHTLNLSHFCLMLITLVCVVSMPLYTSDYFLLPYNTHIVIPIHNSLLIKPNNGNNQYLKATVKIQLRAANGTFIDSPFETGNLMVKYWKNQLNTPASSILSYSYETISKSITILTATDPQDNGLFDIEALHNYQNQHHFIHSSESSGNQASDVLFVLAVYRFAGTNLTNLLGMTKISDQVKISVSIFKANPAELKCPFCAFKTFCPTNQCECYQQIYSDCKVKRKNIVAKTDPNSKTTDSLILPAGTINFIEIEGENTTKDSYFTQIELEFHGNDQSKSSTIKPERIFSLTMTQNKTNPSYMIPNIYNYKSINSPSFASKITSLTSKESAQSTFLRVSSSDDAIKLYEEISLRKDQILTISIYYLNNTPPSASLSQTVINTNKAVDLSVSMEMSFNVELSQLVEGNDLNIGLIIGMIGLGFFLLLLMICVLHFAVAKRFSIFSIFSNSQSSNRTSMLSVRQRSRKISNISQQASTLPEITFDFMKKLVFRPLKFIYSVDLQRKYSDKNMRKTTFHEQICSICLQEFSCQSMVKYTYCGHILDSKCIEQWFNKEQSCPLCRQKLQTEDISQYESRIMEEVWQNEYYQNVLDQEVNVLKRLYKQWENKKIQTTRQQKECMKYTEESLVDNNFTSSNYIQNAIHNISTLQELEKSQEPIHLTQQNNIAVNSKDSKTKENIVQNLALNQSHIHGISPQKIMLQSVPWLIPVLQASTSVSLKRFIKIYRFYRCIYLYHQINKKFQKDSNLFEPSIIVDEKDSEPHNHRQVDTNQIDLRPIPKVIEIKPECQLQISLNHDNLYMTSRKCMVREHEQDCGPRYNFQENNYQLETNFNSEQKLKSTHSFKKIKNNKHGRAAFHFDFQFNQHELTSSIHQQPSESQGHHPVINPTLIMQDNEEPVLLRQPTDSSQYSQAIKLAKRRKCVSMRDELDGLQREFAGGDRKKSDDVNEDARFRDHDFLFDQEDIDNQRYVDERYVEVMSPVMLSPRKMQLKRQSNNCSNMKQITNRSKQTQSMDHSRGDFKSKGQGNNSRLSNKSKKAQQSSKC